MSDDKRGSSPANPAPDGGAGGQSRPEPERQLRPDLTSRRTVSGRRPGDRLVRIDLPDAFRHAGPGLLIPRASALAPRGAMGRLGRIAKRFLIGRPIATEREIGERLSKANALAILSSDALSSVAYAPEAAMRVLILAGAGALALTLPVTLAIVVLLAIVTASYYQTIRAYPSGGGSYTVAHENLGQLSGLTAAAALLTGYIVTVSVSVAAGVAALSSAFPELRAYDVWIALGALALIALVNLRGVREAGTVFAFPTYIFVIAVLGLIGTGLWRLATGGIPYEPGPAGPLAGSQALGWFLVLSAFAKGCTAMTGTEALSNSVPAFKPPEPRNARITLVWMALLLGSMLLGIGFLVSRIGIVPDPSEAETVMSHLAKLTVGDGLYYFVLQFATALILFLAANTSYTGFPRLLSILARDRYAPRWFGLRGDRLAFTFGIAALTVLAGVLLIAFDVSVDRLLPLYAIGVFTGFTASQAGMVIHWLRSTESHRKRNMVVNGLGAVTTGVVTAVIAYTRFMDGAWLAIVVVTALILGLLAVNGHYRRVAQQLRTQQAVTASAAPTVVVPIPNLNRGVRLALSFALGISKRVIAVHIATDAAEEQKIRDQWQEVAGDIPLVVIESPYRWLVPPLLAYIDTLRASEPHTPLLVLLAEFVPRHWWESFLHNQTALRLKAALLSRPGVAVASLPYHLTQ